MKVSDLIEQLKTLDQEADIMVARYYYDSIEGWDNPDDIGFDLTEYFFRNEDRGSYAKPVREGENIYLLDLM